MATKKPSPLLTSGEVADLFGVETSTVRRWWLKGRIAGFLTPGGHLRIPRSAIEQLQAATEQQ